MARRAWPKGDWTRLTLVELQESDGQADLMGKCDARLRRVGVRGRADPRPRIVWYPELARDPDLLLPRAHRLPHTAAEVLLLVGSVGG